MATPNFPRISTETNESEAADPPDMEVEEKTCRDRTSPGTTKDSYLSLADDGIEPPVGCCAARRPLVSCERFALAAARTEEDSASMDEQTAELLDEDRPDQGADPPRHAIEDRCHADPSALIIDDADVTPASAHPRGGAPRSALEAARDAGRRGREPSGNEVPLKNLGTCLGSGQYT